MTTQCPQCWREFNVGEIWPHNALNVGDFQSLRWKRSTFYLSLNFLPLSQLLTFSISTSYLSLSFLPLSQLFTPLSTPYPSQLLTFYISTSYLLYLNFLPLSQLLTPLNFLPLSQLLTFYISTSNLLFLNYNPSILQTISTGCHSVATVYFI